METVHNIYRFHNSRNPRAIIDTMIFRTIAFVAAAVSTDEAKPALQCIRATDDNLIATNGHLLHVADMPTHTVKERDGDGWKVTKTAVLSPGFYFPVRRISSQVWLVRSTEHDYPDHTRSTSLNPEGTTVEKCLFGDMKNKTGTFLKAFYRRCNDEAGINTSFLKGIEFMDGQVKISVPRELAVIKIEGQGKSIYVMPMRLGQ